MNIASRLPGPRAQVVHQDDRIILAVWDRLIVAITKQVPGEAEFDAFERHARELVGRFSEGIGVVMIPEGPVKTGFDRDALLKRAAEGWEEFRPYMSACTALVEADGFVGSFRRGILTSLLLMARKNTPAKVFSDRAEMASWLAKHLAPGRARYAEQLADALDELTA